MTITLNVNGSDHEIDADPSTPLLYVLRDDLALNGAKYGCGLGQCGACTIQIEERAVFSCLIPICPHRRHCVWRGRYSWSKAHARSSNSSSGSCANILTRSSKELRR